MVKQSLKITHLYPKEMNIYGDTGNVLVLTKRLEWRGIGAEVVKVGVGDDIPDDTDILVSGGGQDTGQIKVQNDLLKKSDSLHALADSGVAMIVICGTYQLFGKRFITHHEKEIKGIGIFDMETIASHDRLIGNIVTSSKWGSLVGYENHSGKTYLADGLEALGRVTKGAGNNGADKSEGAVRDNVFGSYLHGPILPKNPHLADELIKRALNRKYEQVELTDLDDTLAEKAALFASRRQR